MSARTKEDKKYVPEGKRNIAALLAIFLGGLGAHKFYLGQTVQRVVFFLLAWTGIPELIGIIDVVLILLKGRQVF